jgi:cyclopropane fatty-acyl-phospholipid synthase-like methyltransferase
VLELPAVIPFALEMIEAAGLTERISVASVDIVNDPLEGKFDVATARALFQVLSVDECRKVAQNIAAGIAPDGSLFILGLATNDNHLSPAEAVGLNLIFMSLFEGGEAYTEAQYRHWLTDAGFGDIAREQYASGYSLFTGHKL